MLMWNKRQIMLAKTVYFLRWKPRLLLGDTILSYLLFNARHILQAAAWSREVAAHGTSAGDGGWECRMVGIVQQAGINAVWLLSGLWAWAGWDIPVGHIPVQPQEQPAEHGWRGGLQLGHFWLTLPSWLRAARVQVTMKPLNPPFRVITAGLCINESQRYEKKWMNGNPWLESRMKVTYCLVSDVSEQCCWNTSHLAEKDPKKVAQWCNYWCIQPNYLCRAVIQRHSWSCCCQNVG